MSEDLLEYENIHYEYDLSLYSIIHFVKNNIIQILMLLSVVIIIYVVDHISQINAVIYGLPSAIPGLPGSSNNSSNNNKQITPPNHVISKETKVPFRKQKRNYRK